MSSLSSFTLFIVYLCSNANNKELAPLLSPLPRIYFLSQSNRHFLSDAMEVQDEGGQSALHQPQDLFLMQETEVDTKTWLDDTHLKCNACKLWKPKSDVVVTRDLPLAGDWCYAFKCSDCTGGTETFEFLPRSWMDIVQIVIYNLRLRREDELLAEGKEVDKDKMFFRFKEDICYFIDKNWGRVCFGKSRTVTWNNTIGSSLSSHPELFVSGYNYYKQSGFWSTVSPNNPTIGAGGVSVDRSKRLKERKATDSTKERKPSSKKKRRPTEVNPWVDKRAKAKPKKKKNKIPKAAPPVFFAGPLFYEPDGKYRKMCMAKENSARQAKIGADLLTVENEKGYRMVRAAYGAHEGCWFFEVVINQHSGNTRLGWSTEKGDLQAPVGYDGFSFAYRDKEGTIFHQSRGRTHLEPYGPGDVIGFYIRLPPIGEQEPVESAIKPEPTSAPPPPAAPTSVPEASNSGTAAAAGGAASPAKPNAGADSATVGPGDTSPRATAPVPGPEEPPKPGPPLRHTEIRFYKNGRSQGPVFVDMLPAGTYYPAASMYNSASVTFNFGPDFKYPPMDVGTFMPCTRLVQVFDELQEKRKAEAEAAAAIAATKAAEEAALTEAAAAQRKADEMDYSQAHAASSTPYAPAGQPASPYPSTTSSSSYTSPASTAMDVSQGQAAAPTTAPPVSQPPAPEALSGGNDATVSSAGLSTSSAAISLLLNPADDEPMDVDPFFKPSFDSGENRDRG